MSASTRTQSASTPSRTEPRGSELRFWVLSIALHAIVLGGLFLFAPVREIVFSRRVEEPEVITRGDELEEVIEQIRDRTVEQLRARVSLLEAGQERMATNFATLNEHYQPFVQQQRATARSRMEKYIDFVLPHQKELARLIEAAHKGGETADPVAYTHEWASRILTAQEEIRRGISLLELGGDELLARQKQAEETQYEATQFVRLLNEDLRAIEEEKQRLAGFEAALAEKKTEIARIEKTQFEAKVAVKEAEQAFARAEARYKEARAHQRKTRTAEARDAEREASKVLNAAKAALTGAKRAVAGPGAALARDGRELRTLQERIARSRETLREAEQKRDQDLKRAHELQSRASQLQKRVIAAAGSLLQEAPDAP
jgi:hypothetical protein